MATITINGNSMDPVAQKSQFQSLGLESVDSSASDYILIQTRGPLTKQQKAVLVSKNVTILEYVPDDSYIAYYPPKDLTPVKQLPFIVWAGVYPKQVKIEPVLRAQPGVTLGRVANALAAAPPANPLEHQPKTVEVVLHGNVKMDTARTEIAQAAGLDPSAIKLHGGKARLTVSEARLDRLAQLDCVRHIEEYSGEKLYNNVAVRLLGADTVHAGPGFKGAGEVIAVCDTGLDTGDPTQIHPAFRGRVHKLYPLARSVASDPHGHGTHVCGSVLGDGVLADGTPIRGAAPKATLVLQSVLNGNGGLSLPSNLNDLFDTPYTDDGARVHSNSWGDVVGDGSYSQQSREVDEFVWAHRDCVICFAAGNDAADRGATGRIAPGSVGAPSTAKNCITVGASESLRPESSLTYHSLSAGKFPVNPIASDKVADNAQGIAAFSGRGPTRDHRIKPDVVGPGCTILSAKSSLIDHDSFWGDSPDPDLYMFDAGTSMATPLVAGCAAVVRESFRVRQGLNPSASLVKAMIVNGAVALQGQYLPTELAPIPNESEGFGLVNLSASLAPAAGDASRAFWDEGPELDVGDERTQTFTVPGGAKRLKVTLAWTDPPGEALQNDLDLIVEAVRPSGTTERHGNMPPDITDFDRNNNVEQVVWDDIIPGDVQITVRAFRIPVSPQSFALVAAAL
jgi:subtilisin family serine protease